MEKIVVTGYGVIAPNTRNIDEFLTNLINGINCLELDVELAPNKKSTIIGRIDEELLDDSGEKNFQRLPKAVRMGIKAGKEALNQSNLHNLSGKKVGIFIGTSLGSMGEEVFQQSVLQVHESNHRKVPVIFSHYANHHSVTAAIAYYLGIKGITKTITTGCTSSLEAVEEAMMYLHAGKLDVAIVGGTDSVIDKLATYGFAKTKSISLNQSLQEGASPFSLSSTGMAISEASGVLVLEKEGHAIKRDARILGEIENICSNNDGVEIFSVDKTGKMMIEALDEVTSGRYPDYINSQGLGIKINDHIEMKCSKELFNHEVPYTSIKSMYGNPYGASGALQVISGLLSIQYGFIPPTIRTDRRGFEEMNIITDTVFTQINEVAITNHGYGGNNACVYIKKYEQSGEQH
ncbi:MAG TPA: beta-ketoacyl synthase N-terminal-like domain-containing protein [Niallia sp.]|nr:beta-ketoacyl synthase N-terminal-like domain-containing protein [Niallia sp.]